jgi:hypothetical protein
MAKRARQFNPTNITELRGGAMGEEVVELIGKALDSVKAHGGQAVVAVTFKVKTNKRGTAIEVLDKIKIKKPLAGETEKYEETILPERVCHALALEDPGQQHLPETD